ncbi:MAG TPA: glycosyltransferase, partial [Gemmatimonadales bacterium]|nr:glycosyltransferase [Gemmatimonadales bacterium]
MASRPTLLFLSHCLPYPPHAGVLNRAFHLARELARDWDIRMVACYRRNHHPDDAARAAAQEGLRGIVAMAGDPVAISAEWSTARRVWDHLRSVVRGRAYTWYEYRSPGFARALHAALTAAPAPDLVHLESLDLHGYLDQLPPGVPVACTHHNIESELLRARSGAVRSVLTARYLRHQAGLVEAVERRLTPRLALNVVVSDADAGRLHALAPEARVVVVPNGVDTDRLRPAPETEERDGRVVFVGPTYAFQNRDAVDYLVSDIWPRVLAARPGATLELVGRGPAADLDRYARVPGVIVAGHVADLGAALARAQCAVAPIRVGGGTRLKILDGWAAGRAVVSTAVGCEGLRALDGENLLVRDRPEEFAEGVVRILTDAVLRRRLGRAARDTAERFYGWPALGAGLRQA